MQMITKKVFITKPIILSSDHKILFIGTVRNVREKKMPVIVRAESIFK